MKINSGAAQQARELYHRQNEQAKPAGAAGTEAAQAQKPDLADISAAGRLKAQALAAVTAAPDTRSDLVARLHSEVQSGTYKVDERQLAGRIVNQVDIGA
ncbi:MAG: flagellar biosynthesis anti-sigma factor FlgM [Chloroflexota bacterium]